MRHLHLIMPVHSDEHFTSKRDLIQRVAADEGWSLQIPEYDVQNPIFDLQRSLSLLQRADRVCADLTNERPSCYFELGLAEALGRPTRLIAESGTEIHQTSHRHSVIFFDGIESYEAALRFALS